MKHYEAYINHVRESGKEDLAEAVEETVFDVIPKYIRGFSFREHVVSLLMGNVQSGKTSHMFGIISAAADEGFRVFIILTTDNIHLQKQTQQRAKNDLLTFDVFGEEDYPSFVSSSLRKPIIIVLKKNPRILRQWKNNLAITNFCAGNPLFIADDEADAASLNTLVNKNRTSTIFRTISEIRQT